MSFEFVNLVDRLRKRGKGTQNEVRIVFECRDAINDLIEVVGKRGCC